MSDTTNAGAPLAPPAAAPAPTAAPVTSTSFVGLPHERFEAQRRDLQRRDPVTNPDLIMKRDAAGAVVFHEKVVDPKTGEVKAGKVFAGAAATPAGPSLPESVGDAERLTVGDISVTEAELRDLIANKAAQDSRKALIPESPKGYKLELPKDLKLPAGITFDLNPNDPLKGPSLEMARNFAHAKGMSQADFSEMMGVYAAATSGEQIMIAQAAEREKAALGAAGPTRVDAVIRWLRAEFGDTGAKPFIQTLATARQADGWEQIIRKQTNQGAGSFSRRGSEPPGDGKVDQKTYDSWTYTQKTDYARRMTARAEHSGRR